MRFLILALLSLLLACTSNHVEKKEIQSRWDNLDKFPCLRDEYKIEYQQFEKLIPAKSKFNFSKEARECFILIWDTLITFGDKNSQLKAQAHFLKAKLHLFENNTNEAYKELQNIEKVSNSILYQNSVLALSRIDFDNSNYALSKQRLNNIIRDDVNNNYAIEAKYLLSWSEYKLENYSESIDTFLSTIKLINNDNSQFKEIKLDSYRAIILAVDKLCKNKNLLNTTILNKLKTKKSKLISLIEADKFKFEKIKNVELKNCISKIMI